MRDGKVHKSSQNTPQPKDIAPSSKKESTSNHLSLGNLSGNMITQLQRTVGNKMVGQLLTNNNVIQPKRLYKDVPNNRQGTDSRVQEFSSSTHATVFPDSQAFAGSLDYEFISPRWVSSFHITQDGGRNRAYYTDEGDLIDTHLNRGDEKALSGYAARYQSMLDGVDHYTDDEARDEDIVLQDAEDSARIAAATADAERKKKQTARTNNLIVETIKASEDFNLSPEQIITKWFVFFRANKAKDGIPDITQDNFVARYEHYQKQLRDRAAKRALEANTVPDLEQENDDNNKKRKVDDEKKEEKKEAEVDK
ncbi:hypothetical protein HQN90_01305 [Paenibacillus alba]|uniref:hypothetical protein n=1 Tax=Paenibacillus alba TaxID=1197127 RepID=UPI0015660200|nr:hypothetical protein [Paenibacillus alba]NQX64752.1 hypothetical protein [Paenibacillus alba]